jgi:hypothetical protein
MARSRRFLYLAFSGLNGLILTLTVTTCGGSGAPTSPSPLTGGAANAGMVAGTGTCQYSAAPTSFDFGPSADTGEVIVTVTGVAANGERCTWWAESHTLSNDWIDIEGAMTGNGLIPANGGGVVIVAANGTLQFSVPNEASVTGGAPAGGLAIDCKTFDATDYTMNPTTASFDYAGGAGPPITVEVAPPKTREGSILIREQGSNILLFTIPVTQTGSNCSWYLKPANCPNGTNCNIPITNATPVSDWISIDGNLQGVGPIIEGSGTANFSVSAGDVPAGNLAPRIGIILLYDEALDDLKGLFNINQTGEPAEEPEPEPECSYSYAISQSEFGFPGGTAQLTVTVTGVAANGEQCTWWAESHTLSNDWISVVSCPGGICYGTQTVQVVVQPGDVPAQGPAPRSGTVGIWKNVGATFEKEFDVPISQTAGR